jgi:hypothetical protein
VPPIQRSGLPCRRREAVKAAKINGAEQLGDVFFTYLCGTSGSALYG